MDTQYRPQLIDDPGVRFGIATGLVVVTYFVAGLAGLGAVETAVAAVLVAGLSAARLNGLIAIALGVITWAFFTGFVENGFGQLTFAAADLDRLALFAVSVACVASGLRHVQRGAAVRHG